MPTKMSDEDKAKFAAAQEKAKADSENQKAADEKQLDKTIAGGLYVVDGKVVDANGAELKG